MSVFKHLIYICIAILLSSCSSTKQNMVGNNRDRHSCIASAGYIWSEVQKNCIRLFETGIRVESLKSPNESAFIVFSPDSLKAELFFSNGSKSEILDKRTLPNGSFAWNVEDDDTKNVRKSDGIWTISQRGSVQYTQPEDLQVLKYEGMNISEMNTMLLQKIEELTLYMIELKKENTQIKEQLNTFRTKIN